MQSYKKAENLENSSFYVCGSAKTKTDLIDFPDTFFSKRSQRAWLINSTFSPKEFLAVMRGESSVDAVREISKTHLSTQRLYEIEKDFAKFHDYGEPKNVEIRISEKMCECLQGSSNVYGCCVVQCGKNECCPKTLDADLGAMISWDLDNDFRVELSRALHRHKRFSTLSGEKMGRLPKHSFADSEAMY